MKHWKPLLTISYQQTRKARKKIYGIPPLFMQETKSKIYEMIDVNIFVNEINLLLLGLQALLFPQKRKLGWYLGSVNKNAHLLHWNYGKQS